MGDLGDTFLSPRSHRPSPLTHHNRLVDTSTGIRNSSEGAKFWLSPNISVRETHLHVFARVEWWKNWEKMTLRPSWNGELGNIGNENDAADWMRLGWRRVAPLLAGDRHGKCDEMQTNVRVLLHRPRDSLFRNTRKQYYHWGRGPLETGRNMLGTLKGQEPFTWHVSTQHISGTYVMFLAHFPYM